MLPTTFQKYIMNGTFNSRLILNNAQADMAFMAEIRRGFFDFFTSVESSSSLYFICESLENPEDDPSFGSRDALDLIKNLFRIIIYEDALMGQNSNIPHPMGDRVAEYATDITFSLVARLALASLDAPLVTSEEFLALYRAKATAINHKLLEIDGCFDARGNLCSMEDINRYKHEQMQQFNSKSESLTSILETQNNETLTFEEPPVEIDKILRAQDKALPDVQEKVETYLRQQDHALENQARCNNINQQVASSVCVDSTRMPATPMPRHELKTLDMGLQSIGYGADDDLNDNEELYEADNSWLPKETLPAEVGFKDPLIKEDSHYKGAVQPLCDKFGKYLLTGAGTQLTVKNSAIFCSRAYQYLDKRGKPAFSIDGLPIVLEDNTFTRTTRMVPLSELQYKNVAAYTHGQFSNEQWTQDQLNASTVQAPPDEGNDEMKLIDTDTWEILKDMSNPNNPPPLTPEQIARHKKNAKMFSEIELQQTIHPDDLPPVHEWEGTSKDLLSAVGPTYETQPERANQTMNNFQNNTNNMPVNPERVWFGANAGPNGISTPGAQEAVSFPQNNQPQYQQPVSFPQNNQPQYQQPQPNFQGQQRPVLIQTPSGNVPNYDASANLHQLNASIQQLDKYHATEMIAALEGLHAQNQAVINDMVTNGRYPDEIRSMGNQLMGPVNEMIANQKRFKARALEYANDLRTTLQNNRQVPDMQRQAITPQVNHGTFDDVTSDGMATIRMPDWDADDFDPNWMNTQPAAQTQAPVQQHPQAIQVERLPGHGQPAQQPIQASFEQTSEDAREVKPNANIAKSMVIIKRVEAAARKEVLTEVIGEEFFMLKTDLDEEEVPCIDREVAGFAAASSFSFEGKLNINTTDYFIAIALFGNVAKEVLIKKEDFMDRDKHSAYVIDSDDGEYVADSIVPETLNVSAGPAGIQVADVAFEDVEIIGNDVEAFTGIALAKGNSHKPCVSPYVFDYVIPAAPLSKALLDTAKEAGKQSLPERVKLNGLVALASLTEECNPGIYNYVEAKLTNWWNVTLRDRLSVTEELTLHSFTDADTLEQVFDYLEEIDCTAEAFELFNKEFPGLDVYDTIFLGDDDNYTGMSTTPIDVPEVEEREPVEPGVYSLPVDDEETAEAKEINKFMSMQKDVSISRTEEGYVLPLTQFTSLDVSKGRISPIHAPAIYGLVEGGFNALDKAKTVKGGTETLLLVLANGRVARVIRTTKQPHGHGSYTCSEIVSQL